MTPEAVLDALQLPSAALIDHRVPKTLLIENGAPTAADKRHIESGVEEIRWVGTLKPTTVGVTAFVDDTREVLELAALTMKLRAKAKLPRLVELVHRAIPYHLLLITQSEEAGPHVSLADKRWAQNEGGKVVLDGDIVQCNLSGLALPVREQLMDALALIRQPHANLYALYRGWVDALLTAKAASVTGEFVPASDAEHAKTRAVALDACAELEGRIASIRAAAAREKQLARQVELNMQLKTLRAELDAARSKL